MSRLGKKPISVPANVKVAIDGRKVTVSSGSTNLTFEHRPEVQVRWSAEDKAIHVGIDAKDAEDRVAKALWGTTRAILNNMVTGVTKGYEKTLEINGVGYTAELTGQNLKLKLGYANPLMVAVPPGVKVVVDKNIVRISGADRHAVGQFAANVREKRKPEPYNGKGIKYSTETIRRKQGKAFGA